MVTTTRVTICGTTYALRNITSVKMNFSKPDYKTAFTALFLAFGAFLLSIPGVTPNAPTGLRVFFVIGAIALAVAGIRQIRISLPSYHVVIATSAGEAYALTSTDRDYITSIIASINEAIAKAGA
jgi:hypothetical protein